MLINDTDINQIVTQTHPQLWWWLLWRRSVWYKGRLYEKIWPRKGRHSKVPRGNNAWPPLPSSYLLLCLFCPSLPSLRVPCDYIRPTRITHDNLTISRSLIESHWQSLFWYVRSCIHRFWGMWTSLGSHYSTGNTRASVFKPEEELEKQWCMKRHWQPRATGDL